MKEELRTEPLTEDEIAACNRAFDRLERLHGKKLSPEQREEYLLGFKVMKAQVKGYWKGHKEDKEGD